MKPALFKVVCTSVLCVVALQACTQTLKADTVLLRNEIISIEQKLMDDLATGDTTFWNIHLANNFFIVTEDGTRMNRKEFMSDIHPLPAGYKGHILVTMPQFSFSENTTVINYV